VRGVVFRIEGGNRERDWNWQSDVGEAGAVQTR
jgi:hypothetical protein